MAAAAGEVPGPPEADPLERGDHSWFHFKGETLLDFIVQSSEETKIEASYHKLIPSGSHCFHTGPKPLRHYFRCILSYNNDAALGTTMMNN
ncbi:hypothetical protein DAI22_08g214800 [Oryza sativa Japonica Group]|nr:hypothetical protein DAI22_08g214800 [Oryza sativa Japonica Group]